ncbi:3'-5' exonuclease [Bacillus sp. DNRA2]|uniref:exonuclease domain-containing protein n=1 Tax=Bacillus sp. DNRA2 TaxID=2723053 RepID=UPI00145CB04C|nr:exonuclease domain-containing protein [Bacillus sp. DNRA2]NMD69730.1 3'-5' exonuclease [Bacillus sp. DNRA2]
MAFEPFNQFMRGLQGVFGSAQAQNAQQIAYVRQLQRDLNSEDKLKIPLDQLNVVVFDIETTGFNPEQGDAIISIGAIRVCGNTIQAEDTFYSLVQYNKPLPQKIIELTEITDNDLVDAPPISETLVNFFKYVKDDTLVAHHAGHEKSFLQHASWKLFRTHFKHRVVDTSFLYRVAEPNEKLIRLEDFCEYNGIPAIGRHHALGDAKLTAQLWCLYMKKLQGAGFKNLKEIYERVARL